MLIRKNTPSKGTCFAWLPTWTADGCVWLERVNFEFQDRGYGDWTYTRIEKIKPAKNQFITPPVKLAFIEMSDEPVRAPQAGVHT